MRTCGQRMSNVLDKQKLQALTCENISFQYKREKQEQTLKVFEGLNLSIRQQEFCSILGPSGSGKSTLFRLITGLDQPDSGQILIDGEVSKNRLGHIGYMPQQDLLLPWRSVLDNAILPLELQGLPKQEAREQASKYLIEFGLEGFEKRYPAELSGGMRQRVSFLRAVLSGSSLLLLDEPFSALDSLTRYNMQEWLLQTWGKWKRTILFITHDVEEALFLSDRIFIFSDRPIQQAEEIVVPFKRPRTLDSINTPEFFQLKQELIQRLRTKAGVLR